MLKLIILLNIWSNNEMLHDRFSAYNSHRNWLSRLSKVCSVVFSPEILFKTDAKCQVLQFKSIDCGINGGRWRSGNQKGTVLKCFSVAHARKAFSVLRTSQTYPAHPAGTKTEALKYLQLRDVTNFVAFRNSLSLYQFLFSTKRWIITGFCARMQFPPIYISTNDNVWTQSLTSNQITRASFDNIIQIICLQRYHDR